MGYFGIPQWLSSWWGRTSTDQASTSSEPLITTVYGAAGLQRWDVETVKRVFGIASSHGVLDLDTAHTYASTLENEWLVGQAGGAEFFKIHTKAPGFQDGCLRKQKVKDSLLESVEKMHIKTVETFFLHSPDPITPLEETLEAIQELHQEGRFNRFGLSNFSVEELRRVHEICLMKGYVTPTVLQGNYSAVARHAEEELFAVVRELNMSFWAYSPLAGGFLAKTSDYFRNPINKGRWNPDTEVGKLYNRLYNKPHLIAALDTWGEAAERAQCTRAALAYRWVKYHSFLSAKYGDSVLMGASTVNQVTQTLECLNDGPLAPEVVQMIDGVWDVVKSESPFDNYHG